MIEGKYDLYFWHLKDGMSKMYKIANLAHADAISLAAKWIDICEGDFMIVDQNHFPWNDNPSIYPVNRTYIDDLKKD